MGREQRDSKSAQRAQFHGQRVDKTVQWLADSRDSWKEKTQASKAQLKVASLALKRSREARNRYGRQIREERLQARKELNRKDIEIEKLKKQLECANQEIERLKKKR